MEKKGSERLRKRLKTELKRAEKGLLFATLAVLGILGVGTQRTWASEIPTEEQIQEYEQDGSLQDRIDYYEALTENDGQGLIADKLQVENYSRNSHFPTDWNAAKGRMQSEGGAALLIVRVEFQDKTFAEGDTEEALEKIAFGPEDKSDSCYPYESLAAYYYRSSYGKLKLDGKVYSYKAQHDRDYYGANEERLKELYLEVMDALDEQGVDFSLFDKNNDGYLDGVYFHFAGETGGWGSIWWSAVYQSSIEEKEYDGKKIGYHGKIMEQSQDSDATNTWIHETGHMLGLPDYYSYTTHSFEGGIRTYDMMCNNIGDHNAFSKWLLGWIEDDEILQLSLDEKDLVEQNVTLSSLSSLESEDGAYKAAVVSMRGEGIFSEYYLVEYDTEAENQSGLRFSNSDYKEQSLPEGFRVFHINATLNENHTAFAYSNRTGGRPKLIELTDPDGSEPHRDGGVATAGERVYGNVPGAENAEKYGCYYSNGDSLTPNTDPATTLDDERYYGKSGISLTDFNPQGESGTVQVTIQPVEPPKPSDLKITVGKPWDAICQSNVISLPIELSEKVSLKEEKAPYLTLKDGTRLQGRLYIYTAQKYQLLFESSELPEGEYDLTFPAGTFQMVGDVDSLEEHFTVKVGANAKYQKDLSIDPGYFYAESTTIDDGWAIMSYNPEESQKIYFTKISKTGEISKTTIDTSSWEPWISGWTQGYPIDLLQMQDGTWVLSIADHEYECTWVAHLDEQGNLLGKVQRLSIPTIELVQVGNTIKAVERSQSNAVSMMWNLDFEGEPQAVESEYYGCNFYFLENGYLIGHLSGSPVGFYAEDRESLDELQSDEFKMDYDYMDEKDQKTRTYEFEFGTDVEQLFGMDQMGAVEKDGMIYLFDKQDGSESWDDGYYTYTDLTLYICKINKETGEMTEKTEVKEPLRYMKADDESITSKNMKMNWSNGKLFVQVQLSGSATGGISDNYLLNLDGTIEKRISGRSSTMALLSGKQLLVQNSGEEGTTYRVYSFADSDDPSKPDDPAKPDDPVTPDDPSKPDTPSNPENPKTDVTDQKAGKTKEAAKTGDQTRIPYAMVGLAAGIGLAAGVLVYRKKREI